MIRILISLLLFTSFSVIAQQKDSFQTILSEEFIFTPQIAQLFWEYLHASNL